jgi:hypothetical protein
MEFDAFREALDDWLGEHDDHIEADIARPWQSGLPAGSGSAAVRHRDRARY